MKAQACIRAVLTIVAATGALMGAAVAPATAAGPQRETFSFTEADTIDCSQFNPSWQFHDDFVDFLTIRRSLYVNAAGDVIRIVDHVEHHSNDVNSVTGYTLHEHDKFRVEYDLLAETATFSGAQGNMQRPGHGSVINYTGHKIFSFSSDVPIKDAGPNSADDEDFCRAVAP